MSVILPDVTLPGNVISTFLPGGVASQQEKYIKKIKIILFVVI